MCAVQVTQMTELSSEDLSATKHEEFLTKLTVNPIAERSKEARHHGPQATLSSHTAEAPQHSKLCDGDRDMLVERARVSIRRRQCHSTGHRISWANESPNCICHVTTSHDVLYCFSQVQAVPARGRTGETPPLLCL